MWATTSIFLPIVTFAAEAGYRDLGLGPVDLLARVGGMNYRLQKNVGGVRNDYDGNAPVYGVGLWFTIAHVGLRAEYERIKIDELDKTDMVTKVLVVGISNQTSVRRSFEETFAESLTKQGVQAIPSYTLIPADGQIAEDALQKAVEQAGADGVLITRMVDRQTEISVSPSSSAPPAYDMHRQYYGYYTGAWGSYYEPETVQTTEYIVAETTLFRANAPEPVWSGTTRTLKPGAVRKATQGFAKVMIAAMRKKGLI